MSLTTINSITSPPTASLPAPGFSAPDRTLNRAVSAAVGKLNNAGYAGEGREVTFSIDQATRQPIIKVIDSSTKEVITQWPPEYLLALADEKTNNG